MKKLLLALLLFGAPACLQAQDKPAPKPVVVHKGKTYYTGRVAPKGLLAMQAASEKLHRKTLNALPRATEPAFDCRAQGWTGVVKDQSQCGSCWDFSGCETAECAFIKAGWFKGDGKVTLSPQYILDCAQSGGCGGDDNTTVLIWAKATGLATDQDYGPYQAQSGACKYKSGMQLYKLQDWGFVDGSGQGVTDTQKIKDAMKAYGAIGCAIDASVLGDGTGIISGTGHSIDHDVLLVGWDDKLGRGGCWIMQNSWGTSWGVQGYCTIEYGAGDVGTEAVFAVAPPAPGPSPQPPVITSPLTATGTVGAPFSYQIVATNAPTSYAALNLPAGLSCCGTAGTITGTPTAAGVSTVTLSAANAAGAGTASLALTVSAGPVPPPGPTPPYPPVTLTLTNDQVLSVISQSGAVTISGDMSVRQLLDALNKCREPGRPFVPVKVKGVSEPATKDDRFDSLERELQDTKRGLDAVIKMLLKQHKSSRRIDDAKSSGRPGVRLGRLSPGSRGNVPGPGETAGALGRSPARPSL